MPTYVIESLCYIVFLGNIPLKYIRFVQRTQIQSVGFFLIIIVAVRKFVRKLFAIIFFN